MSRIDEALKRAAEGRGEKVLDLPIAQPSRTEEAAIRLYPQERSPAPQRLEQVVPRAQPERVRAFPPQQTPHADGLDLSRADPRLVLNGHHTVQLEQYRRLAAILHEAQEERQLKIVAVTSSVPREGKTLTAVNLALTLSESYGRQVLLVDADLRRPSTHTVLGISNSTGLAETLRAGHLDPRLIDLSPRCRVLTAGRPERDPLAALSSNRMRELLDHCSSQVDWVVIDTPPVGVLTDAQIIARLSHAVLFVIAAGATPFSTVERSIAEVGRECIIGTVLNRVDEGAIPETSYYGYESDVHETGSDLPVRR